VGKLVIQIASSTRGLEFEISNFCIFYNLFNNIRMHICDSKDIAYASRKMSLI
jgi:hypothetical protein